MWRTAKKHIMCKWYATLVTNLDTVGLCGLNKCELLTLYPVGWALNGIFRCISKRKSAVKIKICNDICCLSSSISAIYKEATPLRIHLWVHLPKRHHFITVRQVFVRFWCHAPGKFWGWKLDTWTRKHQRQLDRSGTAIGRSRLAILYT